jgi:hypothetical protein
VGGGGGHQKDFSGHTKNIFPDIPNTFLQTFENFAGHIKTFSLTSRNFCKDTKMFSGHIKIFPKFLCFARMSH